MTPPKMKSPRERALAAITLLAFFATLRAAWTLLAAATIESGRSGTTLYNAVFAVALWYAVVLVRRIPPP
jgi:hypothetical protein